MGGKMERWFRIIKMMHSGERIFVRDMAEEFGKSSRTIYRDLQALDEAGYPFYWDKNKGYCMDRKYSLRNIHLTDFEALAILMCIDAFESANFPFAGALQLGRDKLLASLPEKMRRLISEKLEVAEIDLAERYNVDEAVFEKLQKAAHEKRKIKILYHSQTTSQQATERVVDPYGLICRERAWYLVAYCHLRNELRVFRPDRILSINLLDENFVMPGDFSLQSVFEYSWNIERGKKVRVQLRFFPEVAANVKKARYHNTQTFTDLPDGSVIMEVTVTGLWEIARWILSFGPVVEVLEPPELRRNVSDMAKRTSELYN